MTKPTELFNNIRKNAVKTFEEIPSTNIHTYVHTCKYIIHPHVNTCALSTVQLECNEILRILEIFNRGIGIEIILK